MVSLSKILPTPAEAGAVLGALALSAVSKSPVASAISAAAYAGATASMLVKGRGIEIPFKKENVVKVAAGAGLVLGFAGYLNVVGAVVLVAAVARLVVINKDVDRRAVVARAWEGHRGEDEQDVQPVTRAQRRGGYSGEDVRNILDTNPTSPPHTRSGKVYSRTR